MQSRFQLLERAYRTDIGRLELIAQADYALGQMKIEKCPLCGSDLPDSHGNPEAVSPELRAGCEAEVRKTRALLDDLLTTIHQVQHERAAVDDERKSALRDLEAIETELSQVIGPRARTVSASLTELLAMKSRLERATFLRGQLMTLEKHREDGIGAAEPDEPDDRSFGGASTRETGGLCRVIEGLLREWQFPSLDRVEFSEKAQDIVISGKDRNGHGKGFRAIAYAAFIIGLLRHCRAKALPHPGLVVLDSPLVTYQRPDVPEGEAIGDDVIAAFYASLSKAPRTEQIIVLENENPSEALRDTINYIHFTCSRQVGRYGFFPIQARS